MVSLRNLYTYIRITYKGGTRFGADKYTATKVKSTRRDSIMYTIHAPFHRHTQTHAYAIKRVVVDVRSCLMGRNTGRYCLVRPRSLIYYTRSK